MKKDLVVIGGGPAGYVAAIRGAQLGLDVVLIEKDSLGGTCLNRGCIPTKVHYKNAEFIESIKNSDKFGVSIDGFSYDFNKFVERKESIVNKLVSGIAELLKSNQVNTISGLGKILNPNLVEVTTNDGVENIECDKILIATGSTPSLLPINGNDIEGVVTSDELIHMKDVPKRITVIGAGVIGVEFSSILNSYGSEVTLVEYLPRILPFLDDDISKRMAVSLKKAGIKVNTTTKVSEIVKDEDGSLIVKAEDKKGKEVEFASDTILLSTGRAINVEGLNLESIGVDYDRTGIKVDEYYQTSIPNIYAVGDVIGGAMLAHVASHEAICAVENMMGEENKVNYNAVPSCVFTFPEVASVGYTEKQAKEEGLDIIVSKFMFGGNGKALTMEKGEGFMKVIATEDKKIIGAHVMGPHASDLIHEPTLAIEKGLTSHDIKETIHAHPSLSEVFLEASMGLDNIAIHLTANKQNVIRRAK